MVIMNPEVVYERGPRLNLWKNTDFTKMWIGQTISMFGSQITAFAIPLVATITLKATPLQMGVLQAVQYVPFLLFGLVAGVWIDRLRKRPVLTTSDFLSATFLILIPILSFVKLLDMNILLVISFVVGVLATFFAVAYQSYLPVLCREQLLEGNSKIEFSRSIAQLAGPGVAGILVQVLTGPGTIILDAASFIVSGMFFIWISFVEPVKVRETGHTNIIDEMKVGLRVVFKSRLLRSIAGCSATSNFFEYMVNAILVLYIIRTLGFSSLTYGIIIMLGSTGAIFSSMCTTTLIKRYGIGPICVFAILLSGIGQLIIPFALYPNTMTIVILVVAKLVFSFGMTLYDISQVSLRQMITEEHLQGRMNATMRFLVWGAIPFGSLAGGVLGELLGLHLTLEIAVVGGLLSFTWIYFSPVRSFRFLEKSSSNNAN
jgi:MFS family permease